MESIISNVIGVLIGALITVLAARKYYEKASIDLAKEASELKYLNELMLRGMENAGLAQFGRDENGNIKGLLITFSANVSCESSISGNLSASDEEKI